jgi:O-antigen/teichoic acid export membrane protein
MAPHPLRRLAASGMAYQSASLVAGVLALVTLPLYTHHLSKAEFGWAELLLTSIILLSIALRVGLQEALVRHWFLDDDADRRSRLARRVVLVVLAGTTALSLVVVAAADPIADLLLADGGPPGPVRAAALGLFAFTNLEVANALLRAQEARRTYLTASLCNVALTVGSTVVLVVVLDGGASEYLLGNYAASTVVLVGVWVSQRRVLLGARGRGAPDTGVAMGPLLRFGLPTVVPELAVFLLNVVDRAWLMGTSGAASAGIYAAAVKLATLVIVVARAFQAAWPPLAYDLSDDDAPKAYAQVVRAYVLVLGWMVVGLTLLRHQVVEVLVADEYAAAAGALPWLALGWALWGLTWVFTTIAGRHHVTGRTLPAALLGLVVNIAALALLVPSLEATGAAIALVAAYVVALGAAHLRTRRLMAVPFDWARMAAAVGLMVLVAAGLDWVAAPDGVGGIALRVLGCAAVPPLLVLVGAVRPSEVAVVRRALVSRRRGAA